MKLRNLIMTAFLLTLIPAPVLGQLEWIQATDSAGWLWRSQQGAVSFGNELWMMGGIYSAHCNDVWHSANGADWTQAPDASWSGRQAFGCTVFNNRIYVTAGMGDAGALPRDVWYTTDGSNWVLVDSAAPWTGRSGAELVVFNGRLHMVGGLKDPYVFLNEIWTSGDGENWTEVTPAAPWPPRTSHVALVFDDRLWVMSGWENDGPLNDVWSCDTAYNWTRHTDSAPWFARREAAGAVFENSLWLLGGYGRADGFYDDVWRTTDGENWEQLADSSPWLGRNGHSVVVHDDRLWLFAGRNQRDVWYTRGTGIAEQDPATSIGHGTGMTTVVRAVFLWTGADLSVLLDASGRMVATLHKGNNDLRDLAPGVYFARSLQEPSSSVRVVLVH